MNTQNDINDDLGCFVMMTRNTVAVLLRAVEISVVSEYEYAEA